MGIREVVIQTNDNRCKEVLSSFLEKYLHPAFGALPKREIDVLVLELLQKLGFIENDPSIYEFITQLRVTRSKARNLFYDLELRQLDKEKLDDKVREALKRPLIQKQGDLFVLEIENPLVSDHLRALVQSVGYATDGSFSPSLIKLTGDSFAALITHFVDTASQETLKQALIGAGAPDTSFQGVVKSVLKKLGAKIADDAGAALAEHVSDYLSPLIDGTVEQVRTMFGKLLGERDEE